MSSQDTESYDNLPNNLKQLIDAAFDSILRVDSNDDNNDLDHPRKRRSTRTHNGLDDRATTMINDDHEAELNMNYPLIHGDIEPGGFIIDDDDKHTSTSTPEPGGFLLSSVPKSKSPSSSPSPTTTIPLSLIPHALAALNFPPDDEEVLVVFRTAAAGWSRSGTSQQGQQEEGEQGTVSRKDFRAVCAVLLEAEAESASVAQIDSSPVLASAASTPFPEGGGFIIPDDADARDAVESELSADTDAYQDQDSDFDSDDDGGSEDEYVDASQSRHRKATSFRSLRGSAKSKSKGKGKERFLASDDSDYESNANRRRKRADPAQPTPNQRREARTAFGLFFPDITDDRLDSQRITIKDINRVAKLLKERITAEEVRFQINLLIHFSVLRCCLSTFNF